MHHLYAVAIHIGKIIKEVIKQKGFRQVLLAESINTSKQNLQNIFERASIDTNMLLKISKVLNHNFFQYYLNELPTSENSHLLDYEIQILEKKLLETVEKLRATQKIIKKSIQKNK
jgi:transcriptional regulator with XRE-family HTH domain